MPWLKWDQLTFKQKIQTRMLRLHWKAEEFKLFDFYIKKDGNVPKVAGGWHRLTDKECERRLREIEEIAIYHPEKGDLHLWGPGHSFTFIKD